MPWGSLDCLTRGRQRTPLVPLDVPLCFLFQHTDTAGQHRSPRPQPANSTHVPNLPCAVDKRRTPILAPQEKLEKRIRTFLRSEEENRRCFDCAALGPSYVVLTNRTGGPINVFVCSGCSGLHRNVQHRVKSITAAKFSEAEVDALVDRGGNHRARLYWLGRWDRDRQSRPQQTDLRGIENWIADVFERSKFKDESMKVRHLSAFLCPSQQPPPPLLLPRDRRRVLR